MGNFFGKKKEVKNEKNSEVPIVNNKPSNVAIFGAGCYWGTEKFFKSSHNPAWRSVLEGQVGFMGPLTAKENPSYKEVCTGSTGHVEVFKLTFDGDDSTFEEICRFFFQFHDPTTQDRQGNDTGSQYASVVYCSNDNQFQIANKVKSELQTYITNGEITCFEGKKVFTDIRISTIFYPAHKEHQEYLENNPKGYCNHRIRFKKWPIVN